MIVSAGGGLNARLEPMTSKPIRIAPFRASILFALAAVLGIGASSATAEAGADKSCHKKTFAFAEVRELCNDASKGRPAVMIMMAKATKRANKGGGNTTCLSCHTNQTQYDLKPNAVAEFRKLLQP